MTFLLTNWKIKFMSTENMILVYWLLFIDTKIIAKKMFYSIAIMGYTDCTVYTLIIGVIFFNLKNEIF